MQEFIIDTKKTGNDLDIGRFSAGQGGLASEPMIDMHTQELKNLNLKIIRLFIQEYFNLYPKKGVYNWKRLDRSVDAIMATGAKPMMCIVFKPKLLFPKIDHTIVRPNDWKQWEKLVYELVKHYNTDKKYGIEYWEVANEPNVGEYGGCPYLFTAKNYPEFYEHTIKAIKRADPKAKVGGPALAGFEPPKKSNLLYSYTGDILAGLLKYCSKNKLPLDFVSWHIYSDDPGEFKRSIIYVKKLIKKNKLNCETSINEWNVGFNSILQNVNNPGIQPCFIVEVINHMIEQGLSNCCFYHIRNINGPKEMYNFLSNDRAVIATDGQNYGFTLLGMFDYQGVPKPAYFAFKMLSRLLGKQIKVKQTGKNVKLLAAYDEKMDLTTALIWNFKVKDAKPEKVNLKFVNINEAGGLYSRYMLDAKTDSNMEDDRMKLVKHGNLSRLKEIKDTFVLPPYGIAQIAYKGR